MTNFTVYDINNIFAKILRHEVPCQKVLENEVFLAFHDVQPKAKIHILAIPKGPYQDSQSFYHHAPPDEIMGYYKGIEEVVEKLNLYATGYRLISNCGIHAGQEVPHFHTHILAGQPLGAMLGNLKQD